MSDRAIGFPPPPPPPSTPLPSIPSSMSGGATGVDVTSTTYTNALNQHAGRTVIRSPVPKPQPPAGRYPKRALFLSPKPPPPPPPLPATYDTIETDGTTPETDEPIRIHNRHTSVDGEVAKGAHQTANSARFLTETSAAEEGQTETADVPQPQPQPQPPPPQPQPAAARKKPPPVPKPVATTTTSGDAWQPPPPPPQSRPLAPAATPPPIPSRPLTTHLDTKHSIPTAPFVAPQMLESAQHQQLAMHSATPSTANHLTASTSAATKSTAMPAANATRPVPVPVPVRYPPIELHQLPDASGDLKMPKPVAVPTVHPFLTSLPAAAPPIRPLPNQLSAALSSFNSARARAATTTVDGPSHLYHHSIAIAPLSPLSHNARPSATPSGVLTNGPILTPGMRIDEVFFAPPFGDRITSSDREPMHHMLSICPFQMIKDLLTLTDDVARQLAFDDNYSMPFVGRLISLRNDFSRARFRAASVVSPANPAASTAAAAATATALNTGSGATYFKSFPLHYHPHDGVQYFVPHKFSKAIDEQLPEPEPAKGGRANAKPAAKELVLTIAVPAYNEDADDLKRTLRSLHEQIPDLDSLGLKVHVLVIMDGFFKMDPTTKTYLQSMFRGDWTSAIQPIIPGKESQCIETCIIQRVVHHPSANENTTAVPTTEPSVSHPPLPPAQMSGGGGVPVSVHERVPFAVSAEHEKKAHSSRPKPFGTLQLSPVEIHDGEFLYCSVLIKRDNRRKHNSHAWFLSAFAPAYESDFIFLTDCGTVFSRHALFHMFKELYIHPTWTAATGRPRVMTADQQGVNNENIYQQMTRAAQRFDFESSASSFTAAFSLVGMLPVLPGPCGFYRYPAVKDEAIPFYLESLNQNPDTAGMLMGSLLLAEDRVLSYAAVLKSNNPGGAITAFIPEATFFFEAETDTEKLWTQRRRWINGTVAGYIWLMLNAGMIFHSQIGFLQKTLTTTLIMSQLLMYVVVVLAPSFLALGLNLSLENSQGGVLSEYRIPITIAYLGLYVYFVLVHARLRASDKKVVLWLVAFVTVINAVLSAWLMYWLVRQNLLFHDEISYPTIIVLTYLGTPFLLALMQSPKSFILMLASFIPFILYLPTMTGFWGAYAFARLHDLTWGNRPSGVMLSAAEIGGAASAGLAATAAPAPVAVTPAALSPDQIKAKMQTKAHAICTAIVIANLLSVVSVLVGLQSEPWGFYALAGFMFGFSFFQMIFSFFFFIHHRLKSLNESTRVCGYRCCHCRSKKSYYRNVVRGLPDAPTPKQATNGKLELNGSAVVSRNHAASAGSKSVATVEVANPRLTPFPDPAKVRK